MQSHCKCGYRSPVSVVSRVIDPLIIESEMGVWKHRRVIIGFDDFFRSGMRQLPIPHENAEPTGVQKR